MRVISGKYKGRNILGFTLEGTRPTQDRVKESVSSMIQEEVKGARVLDLFAGSGNLGIEALSNGAKFCCFVDYNPKAIQVINENVSYIPKEDYLLLCLDYQEALERFRESGQKFDLVFLDPPYRDHTISMILEKLQVYHLLNEGALVVCELERDDLKEMEGALTCIKKKKYGYKMVRIYKNGK